MTAMLTAAKSNGREGRVICVRTQDGGKTWKMLGFIGPEPDEKDFAIMPSSVRLSRNSILTAIRHTGWIELYRSDDDGMNWRSLGRPVANTGVHSGNPPYLLAAKRWAAGNYLRFSFRAIWDSHRHQQRRRQNLERTDHLAPRWRNLGSRLHTKRREARRQSRYGLLLQRSKRCGALHRRHDLGPRLLAPEKQ